jgi:putative transposase
MMGGRQGLEKAIAAVWNGVPYVCATLHRAQAQEPAGARTERMHEEVTADYTYMIYASRTLAA